MTISSNDMKYLTLLGKILRPNVDSTREISLKVVRKFRISVSFLKDTHDAMLYMQDAKACLDCCRELCKCKVCKLCQV